MTQQLLTFTALTEDVGLTTIYNFMSRGDPHALFWPSQVLHAHGATTYTQAKYPYMENKNI